MSRRGIIGAWFVLAAVVGACSSSSGSSTGTFGVSDCTKCVNDACSTELATCNGAGDCKAFSDCLDACPSGSTAGGACSRRCAQPSSAAGQSARSGLLTCGKTASTATCNARCAADNGWSDAVGAAVGDGGVSGDDGGATGNDSGQPATDSGTTSGATYASSACGTCVGTTCSSQYATCAGVADCRAWETCVGACPLNGKQVNLTCYGGCTTPTSASGKPAYNALSTCGLTASSTSGACASSCN